MKNDDKKLLEQLERMRRDFVANVSHELRTPLTVIHGYLENLLEQEHDDTKPWKNIFQQMYQHSIRMQNIIEDLLLLSRLENEDQENQEQEIIPVVTMLEELVSDAKNISRENHHKITLQADPSLALIGVAQELKSLFSNIIINAVKYTPPEGSIEISWACKNDHAIFSVSDTGIGIEKKHIPRITERFYRVDKARSRESGGTGLGLAIAKHVLLRHDGTLDITSQLNKGSTFNCIFPKSRIRLMEST